MELKLKNKNIKGISKKVILRYIILFLASSPVPPITLTTKGDIIYPTIANSIEDKKDHTKR